MAREYLCEDGERRLIAAEDATDGLVLRDLGPDGEAGEGAEPAAGDPVTVRLDDRRGALRTAVVDGRVVELGVRRKGDAWHLVIGGIEYVASVDDARFEKLRRVSAIGHGAGSGAARVTAPIPGLVVRVLVEEGQTVERGQPLLILDAMKLENEIDSPSAGVVAKVVAGPGQAVEKGELLIELEAGEA